MTDPFGFTGLILQRAFRKAKSLQLPERALCNYFSKWHGRRRKGKTSHQQQHRK